MDPLQALISVIPDETRERFARKILGLKKKGDQELNQELNGIIDTYIEIPGFRHSSRCPEFQLLRAMISRSSNPVILCPFVHFWVAQMADLVDFLATGYGDHLKNLKETLSEDWFSDELTSVIAAGQQQFPDYEQEDILLVAHWVGRFHERMEEEGNDDTSAGSEDFTSGEVDFAVWTHKLKRLPAESEQWDQLENFIELVKAISRRKKADRQEQSRKREKPIRDFVKKYKQEIEYFGTDPESIERLPLEDAVALVHKLGPLFDQHSALKGKPAVSAEKETQNLAQRQTLISKIQPLLSQSKKTISDNVSVVNQETEQPLQAQPLLEDQEGPRTVAEKTGSSSDASKPCDSDTAKATVESVSRPATEDHTTDIEAISATSQPKAPPSFRLRNIPPRSRRFGKRNESSANHLSCLSAQILQEPWLQQRMLQVAPWLCLRSAGDSFWKDIPG